MELANLIYRLMIDEVMVSQLRASPEEALNRLGLELDQDTISIVVAVLQRYSDHHDLPDGATHSALGGIDWAGRSLPRQSITA